MESVMEFIKNNREILPFILFAVIFISALLIHYYSSRRRSAALQKTAEELGLSFSAEGESEFAEVMKSRIELFFIGSSRIISNVIHNISMPYAVMNVFDYSYTTGSGKSRSVHTFTCALAKYDAKTEFPQFSLVPENFFNRLTDKLFMHSDINFDNYPEFSKKYLLRGNNEEAVRRLFSSAVISSLEIKDNLRIFASGRYVLYYSSGFIKADKIEAFISDARNTIQLFYSSSLKF